MKICVFGASSSEIDVKYIDEVERLGERMAQKGHSLIFGGGAHGLMGAAARGMTRFGGEIIGVAPSFFNVDGILYDKCTDFIFTETMRERKQIMEDDADAFVTAPGGIGTFEEFFEVLTLKQLGRHGKPIAIFNIDGYFDNMLKLMSAAVEQKFMRDECGKLYKAFTSADEMLTYIESGGDGVYVPTKLKFIDDHDKELYQQL